MCWKLTLLFIFCISSGCAYLLVDRPERFLDKYFTLEKQDVKNQLDGPYKLEQILSPNTILIVKNEDKKTVVLRGCLPTGDPDTDRRARKHLGILWETGLYLANDSIVKLDRDRLKAVVYAPAYVLATMNSRGQWEYENQTYTLRQLGLLTYGYSLLDHSDTNYPLYQLFLEAETVSKNYKQGYWAVQNESPAHGRHQ